MIRRVLLVVLVAVAGPGSLHAQTRAYAGVVAGVSTLSADGRSVVGMGMSSVSLYKPENGGALNVLGGMALTDFLSVQANYVWNRNALMLNSTSLSTTPTFYEQARASSQHAVIGDLLLYFRDRASWARPYLSGGVGIVRLESGPGRTLAESGMPMPPMAFSGTTPVLRVAVGIDLEVAQGWALRYSFSETLGRNHISAQLSPMGQRNLANFQNLFGFIRYF